jgi:carboxyl-terminal processing protease
MERWQRYLIVTLAASVAALGVFSAGFAVGSQADRPIFAGSDQSGPLTSGSVQETFDRIMEESVDPPNSEALARGAIKGMVEVLRKSNDPYAYFFNPRGYRSLQELTTGKFSGIGVWLKVKEGDLEIVSVLPDTPALRAGLTTGDVIRTVDGEVLGDVDPDVAIRKIKGPEGTDVSLEIEREGETLAFTITRAEIELPNLEAEMRGADIGYVRLFGFARNAGDQVRAEIEKLEAKGATGIILDLRDNGGGLFTESISVTSVFLNKGKVVTYRSAEEGDVDYDASGDAVTDLPMVVLINEGTASASEIVAGALQDHERATIMGTTSYGKGSVQEIMPLPDASALKFTTAAYLTPDGRNINGKGIVPDLEVEPGPDLEPDLQLQRAIRLLEGTRAGSG